VLADRLQSVVVLKGAGTVCADPAGHWAIVDAGSPALATAGTGDVLAGVIGGLLAQGLTVGAAACLGSWTHARAGELAAMRRAGTIGLAAFELPALIADALNELVSPSIEACA
jgi:NAD(P)H-hydrate repair Nnr-like enzyme with NAD(P)H-hydrate dehydratase domain